MICSFSYVRLFLSLVTEFLEPPLSIYSLKGDKVKTVFEGVREAGMYREVFDASGFPSGIYFIRMQAGSFTDVKKVVLVR